jgi:long-chain fatty acid transport protein
MFALSRRCLQVSVATSALLVTAGSAVAGGLAVREQSAIFQGLSFAGDAAGGTLSSSFWNPAALSVAGWGLQSESALTGIFGSSEVTPRDGTTFPTPPFGVPGPAPGSFLNEAEDIGRPALVAASYYAYRLSPDLVLGLSITAPFGLSTEAEENWGGQYHGRSGKIFTVNVNPMLSYNLASNLSVGVGVQVQYGQIVFKGNPNLGPDHPNAGFDVDDIGFGATAGLLWRPAPGTAIGLGFRSAIEHDFEGDFFVAGGQLNVPLVGTFPFTDVGLEGNVMLPEMVTLSLRQDLSPTTRLLASVEWTNWSRLGVVEFNATSTGGAVVNPIAPGDTVSTFEFNWHDGWFFAVGGEYDYSPNLTLRAGVAYEISPIQNADERFSLITDSDRVWVSAGLSYKWSDRIAFDLAYSHIFFDDASIDRATNTSGAPYALVADVEQSADIVSAGLRIKWGASAPLK